MKPVRYIYTCLLLTLLVLASCKEVFYPDEIVSDEKIPVIQGSIIENERPSVVLSWAVNYEERSIVYISGADVWITDDNGNNRQFIETVPGRYYPDDESYIGVCGHTYVLHVEIDGELYESYPETIHPAPVIDSLYAIPVRETEETLNQFGSVITKTIEGLDIYASLRGATDSTCFLRFHTDVMKETSYILNPNSFFPVYVYEWRTWTMDHIYSVRHTFKSGQDQVLPEHYTGFLEFDYNSALNTDERTAPYPEGWVVSMHVYSVTPGIYQYYRSIGQQLNSDINIFAPVPSQVKGNINCVTNEYEKVIGVFEAASEVVFHKGFSWVDDETYRSVEIDTFPGNPGTGSLRDFPPSFWVSF